MKTIYFLFILMVSNLFFGQEKEGLMIYSFEEVDELQKENPKKEILVFMHTDWCKYCKKMEISTFSDPEIVKKINQKLFFVSFDPEKHKDDIQFRGRVFRYKNLSRNRGIQEIAEHLVGVGNRIEYPTIIIFNIKNEIVFTISSYMSPKQLHKILDNL